jgi:hypothetical protein
VGEEDDLLKSNIELFDDHGADHKVLLRVACATHFMNWERQRRVLHNASLDWLTKTKIDGADRGHLRAGPDGKIARAN